MEYKAEKITPYDGQKSKSKQVEQMFDSIAPAYDFMNRAMTLGIDKWWRRLAVKIVGSYHPHHILDVATGTGDLALQLYRSLHPEHITGIDLAQGMLDIAAVKISKAGLAGKISFAQADCLNLGFATGTFGAVTVAFGVRNFEHLEQGYAEMLRVLRPGGVLCVIELSTPTHPLIKFFYHIYTRGIIPALGRLVSSDRRAYTYLPESIAAVPQGEDMLAIMRRVGFVKCRSKALTLGVCSIYIGEKA